MADQVQFILDRLAPTFNLFVTVHLLNQDELRDVIKKVTDNEYMLKRRELYPKEAFEYCDYLMNLEKLFVLRMEPLLVNASKDSRRDLERARSLLIKQTIYVFERCLRRFPAEAMFLHEFISFLQRVEAWKDLNAVIAKALALHPKSAEFWILAANHEIDRNNNASAARVLYQTGLRKVSSSLVLWKYYFQFELWQAHRLLERRKALELDVDSRETAAKEDSVPSIVFHSAMDATNSLSLGLEMHQLAEECGELSLAHAMELLLMTRFVHEPECWMYFACHPLETLRSHFVSDKRKSALDSLDHLRSQWKRCVARLEELGRRAAAANPSSSPRFVDAVVLRHLQLVVELFRALPAMTQTLADGGERLPLSKRQRIARAADREMDAVTAWNQGMCDVAEEFDALERVAQPWFAVRDGEQWSERAVRALYEACVWRVGLFLQRQEAGHAQCERICENLLAIASHRSASDTQRIVELLDTCLDTVLAAEHCIPAFTAKPTLDKTHETWCRLLSSLASAAEALSSFQRCVRLCQWHSNSVEASDAITKTTFHSVREAIKAPACVDRFAWLLWAVRLYPETDHVYKVHLWVEELARRDPQHWHAVPLDSQWYPLVYARLSRGAAAGQTVSPEQLLRVIDDAGRFIKRNNEWSEIHASPDAQRALEFWNQRQKEIRKRQLATQ